MDKGKGTWWLSNGRFGNKSSKHCVSWIQISMAWKGIL